MFLKCVEIVIFSGKINLRKTVTKNPRGGRVPNQNIFIHQMVVNLILHFPKYSVTWLSLRSTLILSLPLLTSPLINEKKVLFHINKINKKNIMVKESDECKDDYEKNVATVIRNRMLRLRVRKL